MFRFTVRDLLWLTLVVALALGSLGCGQTNRKSGFTDSDACKALLSYVFATESPIRTELLAERFRRTESGACIIVTDKGQLSFDIARRKFTIVRGTDLKTGGPHEIYGEFVVSDEGTLKARIVGQAD